LYIQPGKPTQNAYIERFNRTARHEWLDLHLFGPIKQAQQLATEWLWTYNNERPPEVYLLYDYWMWLNPLLLTSVINGGITERFFRILKTEWMPTTGYQSFNQAKTNIIDCIIGYYS
jgi:hypothetical protein